MFQPQKLMDVMYKTLRQLIFRLRGGTVHHSHDAVFDTAAEQPRNLDDPFSDPKAQARVAKFIAEKGSVMRAPSAKRAPKT